jgi:polysaccharide biosynthesis protein PslG
VRLPTGPVQAAAVAIALVALVSALASRGPPGEGRIGYSTHLAYAGSPRADLARLSNAGVDWIREDFLWETIERTRGRFDWRATDALMAAAAENELDVLAILGYSARWASRGQVHDPPRNPADYAAFARAVVERYGEGGSFWRGADEVRPLKAVELWNEPWGHFFWRPEPDPAAYARLARPAAEAVRSAGAGVDVLMSADLRQVRADGAVRPWFAALLAADPRLPELVDGWSVHPYPEPRDQGPGAGPAGSPYAFARVEQIRALARRRGAMRPIWITEIGWSTSSGPGGVSEARQAAYLGAALDRALGPWRGFVARVFVYGYDRDNGARDDLEGHFGVRRADGSLKPAWDAVARRAG